MEIQDELRRARPKSERAYEEACRVIPSGTVSRARILPLSAAHTREDVARVVEAHRAALRELSAAGHF